MKQLELFRDYTAANPPTPTDTAPNYQSSNEADQIADLVVPGNCHHEADALAIDDANGPPKAVPLPEAIEAGVFGVDTDGPIVPSEEQVADLTAEHANEMIILLADSLLMEESLRLERDPVTGRVPKNEKGKQKLLARLDKEWKRLSRAYTDALAAYADGFGDRAAEKLDQWVRNTVADGGPKQDSYPPSHPWHYFHAGDNAKPTPVESIPPSTEAGKWLAGRLPKNPKKRIQKLCEMLVAEQAALAEDKARYIDLIERGAKALSKYDRTIASDSDAMAVAQALAFKFNHVSLGLGRVVWLLDELNRGPSDLFPSANTAGPSDAPVDEPRTKNSTP